MKVTGKLSCASTLLGLLLCSVSAQAWYFPEHAELTRLALRDYAPGFATNSIQRAVHDAVRRNLWLCSEVSTPLHAVESVGDTVGCVPYGALAALAADHSNHAAELWGSLAQSESRLWPMCDSPPAALLTAAARSTWVEFQKQASPELARIWTRDIERLDTSAIRLPSSVSPRDYVRVLDAQLLILDGSYISRAKNSKAHFHDPTSELATTLAQAAVGDVDNALAQTLAHHARSLQLAVLGRSESDPAERERLRTLALLEHAFAVHFLQDGLAAGHIVTDPAVAASERRAQRHDFFNRQGLAVTRALAKTRCEYEAPSSERSMGLPSCWTAHGDGFAAAQDRLYVGEAVARLQAAFAVALEARSPEWLDAQLGSDACRDWIASAGAPRFSCDLAWTAILLDPDPEWVAPSCRRRADESNGSWAHRVIEDFESALQGLARSPRLLSAHANSARAQAHVLPASVLGHPLESCGGMGGVLLRPVLTAWPSAQADATSLGGADQFGQGLNLQIVANLAGAYADVFTSDATATLWTGLGGGLALSTHGVFPHRRTRALMEFNVGVAEGLLLAGDERRFRSLLVLESRIPVTTGLLYLTGLVWESAGPLELIGHDSTVGLMGGRAYFYIDGDRPILAGWDAEVVNLVISGASNAISASSSGVLDTEARLRVGVRSRDPTRALPGMFDGAFVLAVEVSTGFFSSFL